MELKKVLKYAKQEQEKNFCKANGFSYHTNYNEEVDFWDIIVDSLEKQLADGCEGCKYIHKNEYEMPCLICKRNKIDKWTEDRK